jgi:hypothetical protein
MLYQCQKKARGPATPARQAGAGDSIMPKENGFKSDSYTIESLDDDIIDALPMSEKDFSDIGKASIISFQYIENKMKPQIEKEIKDIVFPDEAKKEEIITKAISIK